MNKYANGKLKLSCKVITSETIILLHFTVKQNETCKMLLKNETTLFSLNFHAGLSECDKLYHKNCLQIMYKQRSRTPCMSQQASSHYHYIILFTRAPSWLKNLFSNSHDCIQSTTATSSRPFISISSQAYFLVSVLLCFFYQGCIAFTYIFIFFLD